MAGRIEAFCREVNTDSLDRFEALVQICDGRSDLSDPAAAEALRELARSEAHSRSILEPEARAIIRAIDAFAAAVRTQIRPGKPSAAPAPRTLGLSAAVVLAAGLACTESNISEMAPPPIDARPSPDAGRDAPVRFDVGGDEPIMSESDAMPLDLRRDVSEVDARPLDADKGSSPRACDSWTPRCR